MRIAEFVEFEQFGRERLAARVPLALVLVDANFQFSGHDKRSFWSRAAWLACMAFPIVSFMTPVLLAAPLNYTILHSDGDCAVKSKVIDLTPDADVRPSPQWHLPFDLRVADHGLRAKRQRAPQRRHGSLCSAARSAGGAGDRIVARAASVENLGLAAWRGHAGRAGAVHRATGPDQPRRAGRGH